MFSFLKFRFRFAFLFCCVCCGLLIPESCIVVIPALIRYFSMSFSPIPSTETPRQCFWNSSSTLSWCWSFLKKRITFLSVERVMNMIRRPTDFMTSSASGKLSLMSSRRIPPKPESSCRSRSLRSCFLSFMWYFGLKTNLPSLWMSLEFSFKASLPNQALSPWLMSVYLIWSSISSKLNGSNSLWRWRRFMKSTIAASTANLCLLLKACVL